MPLRLIRLKPRSRFVRSSAGLVVPTGALGNIYLPPGGGGLSFATPDDFTNINGGTDGFWKNQVFPSTGPAPNGYITANASQGRGGSRCWQAVIAPANDNGFYPTGPQWASASHRYTRWYFRCLTPGLAPSGNVKGWRYQSNGSNAGEIYSNLHIALDFEPAGLFGATWYTGIYWGSGGGEAGVRVNAVNLADGTWHCLEIYYNRNVGGDINVQLWVDGIAVVHPAMNAPGPFSGGTAVQWFGGSRRTNTPSTFRCARSADPGSTNFLTEVYPFLTISQSGPAATLLMDDCASSSQRIGTCLPGQAGTPQWLHEEWVNATGSPLAITAYQGGRWAYTTGSGSDLILPVGGGHIECPTPPAGTNAHARLTASGMPTQNYDVVFSLQYRTNTNCLSEGYIYMQPDSDSGIGCWLSNGNLDVRPLINGTPTGTIASVAVAGLVDGEDYAVRLGKQGNAVRALVIGPNGPVVATGTDTTFVSGAPAVGAFHAPGGQSVRVGVLDVLHNAGI